MLICIFLNSLQNWILNCFSLYWVLQNPIFLKVIDFIINLWVLKNGFSEISLNFVTFCSLFLNKIVVILVILVLILFFDILPILESHELIIGVLGFGCCRSNWFLCRCWSIFCLSINRFAVFKRRWSTESDSIFEIMSWNTNMSVRGFMETVLITGLCFS